MIQDYRTIKTRTISIIRSLRSLLCISIIISVMAIILYTICLPLHNTMYINFVTMAIAMNIIRSIIERMFLYMTYQY